MTAQTIERTSGQATADGMQPCPASPGGARPVSSRRLRRALSALGLAVAVLVLTGCLSQDEQTSLELVNRSRAEQGVAPLVVDEELTAVARDWATQMAGLGEISHRPDSELVAMMPDGWVSAAENVGAGPDVGKVHVAFLGSPSHRASLLDARYSRVGVGVVNGDDGRVYVTHVFME